MAKWKPKERALTPEEALEQATNELKPYWYGSKPLIAGIKGPERSVAVPLSKEFQESTWVLFFIDPASMHRREVFTYAQEYYRRYESLGVRFLMVLRRSYSYLNDKAAVELFISRNGIKFPVVVDHEGALISAFGAKEMPKVIVIDRGKIHIETHGLHWNEGFELKFQNFLRIEDPGLPLLRTFTTEVPKYEDLRAMDFGTQYAPKDLAQLCELTGKWKREPDRMVLDEGAAEIKFKALGSGLAMACQVISKQKLSLRIGVDLNGENWTRPMVGADLQFDDSSNGFIMIDQPRLYQILAEGPKGALITLKFPDVPKSQQIVFGLRWFNTA